jgi:hypothetical protein
MQETLEAMATALRALVALIEKGNPDPADVEALLGYTGPQREVRELDELAREVIQTVLRDMAERRCDGALDGGIGRDLRRRPRWLPTPQ